MRKGQIPGQLNLLTGEEAVELVVAVGRVETMEKDGRDAVIVVSKEEFSRYKTVVLMGWDGNGEPILKETAGWMTPGEYRQAIRIAHDLFKEGREEGRFA